MIGSEDAASASVLDDGGSSDDSDDDSEDDDSEDDDSEDDDSDDDSDDDDSDDDDDDSDGDESDDDSDDDSDDESDDDSDESSEEDKEGIPDVKMLTADNVKAGPPPGFFMKQAKKDSGLPPKDKAAQQALAAHNQYRAAHGVPALKWDAKAADFAKTWAEKIASEGSLRHSSNEQRKGMGENLAMTWGKALTPAAAVKMWYDEIKDYDFKKAKFQFNTGHFTQVVWKGATGLGFHIAKSGNSYYAVANYTAPDGQSAGNMMGEFPQNVFPKGGGEPQPGGPKEKKVKAASKKAIKAAGSAGAPDDFARRAIAKHNELRKKHSAPPMTWDPELAAACKKWAEHLATTGMFAHSRGKGYGENIAMTWSSDTSGAGLTPEKAIDMWYSEIKDMNWNSVESGPHRGVVGHFTQVVWRGSTNLGMAVANKGNSYYAVAQYKEQGNMMGQYAANVSKK